MLGRRRVVVTGMGVISPIGLDLTSFAASLREMRSGVRHLRAYDPAGLPVRIGAEVLDFDARHYLDKKDRKSLKIMSRMVQLAVGAARQAVADSKLDSATLDPLRFGVATGSGPVGGILEDIGQAMQHAYDPLTGKIDLQGWGRKGLHALQPMWMLEHVPNMPSGHLSILHNAQGPNNTIVQSDLGSLLSITEAVNVIQRDAAEVMLAGGSDTRTHLVFMARYPLFSQVSTANDDPEHACRPFDRQRQGQALGEGAGILVLEELEHARRRGARIRAEVVGQASGFDRGRTGVGLARTIRLALDRAGIGPDDLDHVNAHAPATTHDDAWEARGIAQALGSAPVGVVAVKSMLGSIGSGGSVLEVAASLVGLQDGWRPGTRNHEDTDPECPVHVLRTPTPVRRPHFLKIGGTDVGQCAAVVLRRWDE